MKTEENKNTWRALQSMRSIVIEDNGVCGYPPVAYGYAPDVVVMYPLEPMRVTGWEKGFYSPASDEFVLVCKGEPVVYSVKEAMCSTVLGGSWPAYMRARMEWWRKDDGVYGFSVPRDVVDMLARKG